MSTLQRTTSVQRTVALQRMSALRRMLTGQPDTPEMVSINVANFANKLWKISLVNAILSVAKVFFLDAMYR